MVDEASHQVARQVVAKLCLPLGWQGIQNGACDVLADLMKRYIQTLGKATTAYVANANRTEPTPEDVAYAFQDMGISMADLSIYARLVDSSPLPPLPNFPLPRPSSHIYTPPTTPITRPRPLLSLSEEDDGEDGEDVIPPYLPPLPSKKMDDDKDDTESGVHDGVDRDDLMDVTDPFAAPADPDRGLPQLYHSRSRLSSEFSEDGAEGGSRRGSISESSVTIRVPTMEGGSTGEVERQVRPMTPVEGDAIQRPQLPTSLSSSVSGATCLTRPVEVGMTRTASSLNTGSVQYKGDRRVSEPIVRPIVPPVSSDQGECSQPPLTAVRPPPLRLMSMGGSDALPLVSPVLPSPGSTPHGAAARRTSLPLLSPLRTTPTLPQVFPTTKVTMTAIPQLTPTTPPTAVKSYHPPPLSPSSAHPPLLAIGHTDSVSPSPPVNTGHPQEPTSKLGKTEEVGLTQVQKSVQLLPELSHDQTEMSRDLSELSRDRPELSRDRPECTEELISSDTKGSEEVREELTYKDMPKSAFSTALHESSPIESKDHSSEDEQSPPHKYPPLSPPHLPPTHLDTPSPLGGERDGESSEELLATVEGEASLMSPPSPNFELESLELERKTGFDVTAAPPDTRKQTTPTQEPQGDRMRLLDVDRDIDMEGGGEGGVASILHGEEEMELPGIEQQLEMSESEEEEEEEVSSSSSGSEEDIEPPLPATAGEVMQSVEGGEFVDLGAKGLLVQPPHASFARSSSHSLASTPSVSPSPSPIPHPSPVPTGQHSTPVFSSVPVPDHKPSPSKPPAREEAKMKAVFSSAPTDPITQSPTGSLIVSFRKHLIASLSKSSKEEGKRASTKQQKIPSSFPSAHHPTPKAAKSPGRKVKKRHVAPPVPTPPMLTPPDIVVEPPPSSPLIVCIPRSQLRHKLFGLTSAPQQSTLTFSDDEDDDDMIITHSSAEQVKFRPPMERTKPEFGSERVKSAMERVNVPSQHRFSHPSPSSEQYSVPELDGRAGLWKRELDISEMGLLSPAPHATAEEQPVHIRVIPQSSSSSSSSSSGNSDSESGSNSSPHSSPSPPPPPPLHPPVLPPSHSPWQQPIRSEDEESTSSSAGGGLKLKLKISKALLKNVSALSPAEPRKRGRKKGSTGVSMATTSQGGRSGAVPKRGRPSKGSSKSKKRSGSNIPQIKLPKLELPLLPGALPQQQTTPYSEEHRTFRLKLPAVAVSPGGEVWFCPKCSKPDDGSPMIGCDGDCEGWYHWNCVGVVKAPPENEKWYCPSCARSKLKKGRKRRN